MRFSIFSKSKEGMFWKWFQRNQEELFHLERYEPEVFQELSQALKKVHPDLTFEFGPVVDGKKEFTISADGVKDAFASVEALYDAAPPLAMWNVVKFRQRQDSPFVIEVAGKRTEPESVRYCLGEVEGEVGIVLLFKDYCKKEHSLFVLTGFLFLDSILGEYDVETKVGFIDMEGFDSKYITYSKRLGGLAEDFDRYFENRKKI